jgi:hypothetical protein
MVRKKWEDMVMFISFLENAAFRNSTYATLTMEIAAVDCPAEGFAPEPSGERVMVPP